MALIQCDACKSEISKTAKACPKCGHPNKKSSHLSATESIGALIVAGVGLWFFFGGGFEHQANADMQNIENKVASDSVEQYNIAKKQGDKMQICVEAGGVSAAFLQAKDSANYEKWKAIEKSDCAAAGIDK